MQTKARLTGRAFSVWEARSDAGLFHRRDLAELALERLVRFLGESGVELAELGRLGDETLIRAFDVVALHLDRLLERLRADELLGRSGTLLEHLLRIVRHLDRDRLHALRERAERF